MKVYLLLYIILHNMQGSGEKRGGEERNYLSIEWIETGISSRKIRVWVCAYIHLYVVCVSGVLAAGSVSGWECNMVGGDENGVAKIQLGEYLKHTHKIR